MEWHASRGGEGGKRLAGREAGARGKSWEATERAGSSADAGVFSWTTERAGPSADTGVFSWRERAEMPCTVVSLRAVVGQSGRTEKSRRPPSGQGSGA